MLKKSVKTVTLMLPYKQNKN